MERVDKLLANTGRWSRKEVKELVKQGRVTAAGTVVLRPEEKYDGATALAVDGVAVAHSAYTYLMLHKPAGVLSATSDRKQETVLNLLPQHLQKIGLSPVGRLDKDTEGLLLLTDDGALAHDLLAPGKHVDKVYFVRVDGQLDQTDCAAFRAGMTLGDGLCCLPADLAVLTPPNTGLVTLHEGKFHQIKRMLAAQGKPVVYLKRLTMGSLTLDEALPLGSWRPLTDREIADLHENK